VIAVIVVVVLGYIDAVYYDGAYSRAATGLISEILSLSIVSLFLLKSLLAASGQ
jgi:hypothetical protein